MSKGRIITLALTFLGYFSPIQAADWSGEIPNGTVWSGGEVQRITGDVTIASGSTLTIQAGAVVKFNSGRDMFVDGDLVANGTSGSPIYFTSDRDDTVGGDTNGDGSGTSPFAGAWNKVAISSSGSADLDWVIVRYGGDRTFGVQGAVEVNQGSLSYNNGTVSQSDSAGIRIWSANPTITGLNFDSNRNGGVQINLDANPAITSATFTDNGTNGVAVDGGTLSVSGAWDDPGAVYRLTGDVTVPDGLSLSIAAGQVVKMNGGVDLFINGTLNANGSSGQHITFTSDKDDSIGGDTNNDADASAPFVGAWNKLDIGQTGSGNLTWVDVYYGGDRTFGVQGSIEVDQGALTYTNGSVDQSDAAGIRIWSANPVISGLDFDGNRNGGMQMNVDANPDVSNVTFSNNGTNGIAVDSGTLTVDGFWNDPDAVYRLTGDITVPEGRSLTVTAGQRIKLNGGVDLFVNGTMTASGTMADHVVFTSDKDDLVGGDTNNDADGSSPFVGAWNKLDIGPTGSAGLTWVDVSYGGDRTFGVQGAIEVDEGGLTYSNGSVNLSDSAGIRIWSADPSITGVDFDSNVYGAMQMNVDANPAVSNVTFSNNGTNGIDVDGGTLSVNGFWNDPDAVYRLTGDITVPDGLGLTVAADQIVKFNSGVDLFVSGNLSINGTSGSPVTVTSDRDDSMGGDTNNDADGSAPFIGAWNKIDIGPSGQGNFSWLNVDYGGDRTFGVQGAVEVDQGELTFAGGSVNNSDSAGIRIWSATPSIDGLSFDSNWYGGIQINVDANPSVSNVAFSNNGTNGVAVDGGTLTVPGFWDDPDAVYRLTGDVVVPDGLTLTVAGGQTIKGNSGVDITVEGDLVAVGSAAAPVNFSSDRDDSIGGDTNGDGEDTTPFAGSWNGFFVPASGSAEIRYASIRHGGDRTFGYSGSVHLDGGELELANSLVELSDSAAVYAGGGSTVTLSNCILAKSLYGVRTVSSSAATVINCTIDGNDAGAAASDAQLGLTNNIVSNNARVGVEQGGSATVTVTYSDVYNPAASQGNYGGLDDQTGKNGNLSSDPLLGNPDGGIFSLLSGSPAIDSGTSDGAPLTDLVDNARVDDLVIENIGGGSPNYFDMGALERQKGSDPVDLVVEDVEFSPDSGEIGDTVTISWTVRNAGTAPAAAPWSDAIFASEDTQWQLSDERLEVFEQNVTLLPGQSYTETLDIDIPPTLPGTLNFIIRSDYRQQVREIAESNDEVASVEIDIPTIVPGESISIDLTDERPRRYVRVDINLDPIATDLNIDLDDADNLGSNELYVSYERIPTRSDAENSAAEPGADQIVATGQIVLGSYFVLAEGAALGTNPSRVTVSAATEEFGVGSFTPTNATNAGNVTLRLEGFSLDEAAIVRLKDGSVTVAQATDVMLDVDASLFATFDLTGTSPGTYAVEVEQTYQGYDEDADLEFEETLTARASGVLEIGEGGGPSIEYELNTPSAIRPGRMFEYTIDFTNVGTVDARAPLLAVNALSGADLMDPGVSAPTASTVLVMGLSESGPPGLLRPGQSGSLSLSGISATTGEPAQLTVGVGLAEPGGPDFGQFLQDAGVSPSGSLGATALSNFATRFGTAWSTFFGGLGTYAGAFFTRDDLIESVSELSVRTVADSPTPKSKSIRAYAKGIGGGGGCQEVDFESFVFPCIDVNDPRRNVNDPDSIDPQPGSKGIGEISDIRPYCEANYLSLARQVLELKAAAWNVEIAGNAAGDHLSRFLNGDRSDILYTPDSEFSQWVATTSRQLEPVHTAEGTVAVENAIEALFRDGNEPQVGERVYLGSVKKRPDFKRDGAFSVQLRAIGGVRLAAEMTMIVREAREEGDLLVYSGVVEYLFADRYDWQGKNFRKNAFGRAAYDLGWCAGSPPGSNPLGFNVDLVVEVPFTYVETQGCVSKSLSCPLNTDALVPPTMLVAQETVAVRTSFDPNDKVGPATPGGSGFIFEGDPLDYTIFFENDPKFATAPAQEVVIVDELDPDLDWESFELGVFAFGDYRIDAPPGMRSFTAEVDSVNPDGTPLLVTISAEIDLLLGTATWRFLSIDPETGGPPNGVETGFLPVNDEDHRGEGHVTFRIFPRANTAFGTELTNDAEIFFDFNAPIVTPETRHVLTDDFIFSGRFEVLP